MFMCEYPRHAWAALAEAVRIQEALGIVDTEEGAVCFVPLP